jgi:hypothetical protein
MSSARGYPVGYWGMPRCVVPGVCTGGGPFGCPVWWASGDQGVQDPRQGENHHLGRQREWGRYPFVRRRAKQ